jgi:alpha-glucosidase
MEMFAEISQLRYRGAVGREYVWQSDVGPGCLLAGTLLGSQVVRVRLLRGAQIDEVGYPLADGGQGTLPYHSWIVARGDEDWPGAGRLTDVEIRSILAPFLRGWFISPQELRLARPLSSREEVFGLGERTGSLNKRGQAFPIWNVDPPRRHGPQTDSMYVSIPFYLGLMPEDGRAHGVLVDHTGRVEVDLGRGDPSAAWMTVAGDSLVAYFCLGPTPARVLSQLTDLSGRMPLPPRWSLGLHQCRWSYFSQEQVLEVAARLRERKHPCDAIWLDIDYTDGFRNFTWNARTFPEPQRMASRLHQQGMRLVTIIDPGTKVDERYPVYGEGVERDYYCRYQDGEIFSGTVWPGVCVFPDYSQGQVRNWWGDHYQALLDVGVDGFWNDMNEPALMSLQAEGEGIVDPAPATMSVSVLHRAGAELRVGVDGPPTLHAFFHNAYGMEMARSTYEALSRLRPSERPFVLSRAGTAGIQRYAAIWTGDNASQWGDILMAIPMCLNLGMSGVPFVGVDIGGFWEDCDGELLVRFAQLAALMPFCRNHSAQGTHDQEPWAYGEPFESAYRRAIETRYRLLPYLYTLFHDATQSGAPIMRPLYFHHPRDEEACQVQDAFLIGENLLSAPIHTQGATSRSVYLPAGIWFDYWTGDEYPGEGWSDRAAPLDSWPLFIRGNSVLPSIPVMQYADQAPADPLTLSCYMATDGLATYSLYEDDGSSLAYRQGACASIDVSCRVQEGSITVEIEEHCADYRPEREAYEVVVYVAGRKISRRVQAGGGKIVLKL